MCYGYMRFWYLPCARCKKWEMKVLWNKIDSIWKLKFVSKLNLIKVYIVKLSSIRRQETNGQYWFAFDFTFTQTMNASIETKLASISVSPSCIRNHFTIWKYHNIKNVRLCVCYELISPSWKRDDFIAIAIISNMPSKRNFQHFKRFICVRIAYNTIQIIVGEFVCCSWPRRILFEFILFEFDFACHLVDYTCYALHCMKFLFRYSMS